MDVIFDAEKVCVFKFKNSNLKPAIGYEQFIEQDYDEEELLDPENEFIVKWPASLPILPPKRMSKRVAEAEAKNVLRKEDRAATVLFRGTWEEAEQALQRLLTTGSIKEMTKEERRNAKKQTPYTPPADHPKPGSRKGPKGKGSNLNNDQKVLDEIKNAKDLNLLAKLDNKKKGNSSTALKRSIKSDDTGNKNNVPSKKLKKSKQEPSSSDESGDSSDESKDESNSSSSEDQSHHASDSEEEVETQKVEQRVKDTDDISIGSSPSKILDEEADSKILDGEADYTSYHKQLQKELDDELDAAAAPKLEKVKSRKITPQIDSKKSKAVEKATGESSLKIPKVVKKPAQEIEIKKTTGKPKTSKKGDPKVATQPTPEVRTPKITGKPNPAEKKDLKAVTQPRPAETNDPEEDTQPTPEIRTPKITGKPKPAEKKDPKADTQPKPAETNDSKEDTQPTPERGTKPGEETINQAADVIPTASGNEKEKQKEIEEFILAENHFDLLKKVILHEKKKEAKKAAKDAQEEETRLVFKQMCTDLSVQDDTIVKLETWYPPELLKNIQEKKYKKPSLLLLDLIGMFYEDTVLAQYSLTGVGTDKEKFPFDMLYGFFDYLNRNYENKNEIVPIKLLRSVAHRLNRAGKKLKGSDRN